MKFKPESSHCIVSAEGYRISRYDDPAGPIYVARSPKPEMSILGSSRDYHKMKAACAAHLDAQQVAA